MIDLENILLLLNNPFTIIGLIILILLIWTLYHFFKRYTKFEFKITQIEKSISIFERLEIITTYDSSVETIYYNKKLIGYDSKDKNILKLISFHSQFTNETTIKSFIDRKINLYDVLTKNEVNVLKNKDFREKYNFVIKKYKV
jgi:hypothetical protein